MGMKYTRRVDLWRTAYHTHSDRGVVSLELRVMAGSGVYPVRRGVGGRGMLM